MILLKDIELKADELRGDSIPVDVLEIVKNLGYEAYYLSNDLHIAGKVNHKQKKIYINPNDSIPRKRFTIAHEIGHIVFHNKTDNTEHHRLDREFKEKILSVYSDNIEEIEANRFAGILLMPTDKFIEKWREYSESITDIARYFNVSLLSASIRANNLDLIYL